MRCAAVSARYTTGTAEVSYEISIATNILFDGFGGMTANGGQPSAGNRSCPFADSQDFNKLGGERQPILLQFFGVFPFQPQRSAPFQASDTPG
jgi:hypothetical protein